MVDASVINSAEELSTPEVDNDSVAFDLSIAKENHHMGILMTKLSNIGNGIQRSISRGRAKTGGCSFRVSELSLLNSEDCNKIWPDGSFYAARILNIGVRGCMSGSAEWDRDFIQIFTSPTEYVLADCLVFKDKNSMVIKHVYSTDDTKVYENFRSLCKTMEINELLDNEIAA
jgi:hypothetical protein